MIATNLCSYLTCLCLLALGISLGPSQSSTIPNPMIDNEACGNAEKGAICNSQGVLSKSGMQAIKRVQDVIRQNVRMKFCGPNGGVEVGVAVVQALPWWWGVEARSTRIKHTAEGTFNQWGIGNAQCQDGVLLLVAVSERQMYIKTGKGARMVLGDLVAKSILSSMKPLLRTNDYDGAVLLGMKNIGLELGLDPTQLNHIEKTQDNPQDAQPVTGSKGINARTIAITAIRMASFVAAMAICMTSIVFDGARKRGLSHAKRKLVQMRQDAQISKKYTGDTSSCPICMEVRMNFATTLLSPWL